MRLWLYSIVHRRLSIEHLPTKRVRQLHHIQVSQPPFHNWFSFGQFYFFGNLK